MEEYLYILILSGTIVFSTISYFINTRLVSSKISQRILSKFLLFITAHCVVVILAKFCFEEHVFVYLGLPFGFFYAPFLYCCFTAFLQENNDNTSEVVRKKDIFKDVYIHFIPGVIFTLGYIISLWKFNLLDVEFLIDYYLICYISLGVQLIFYATFGYFAISKLDVPMHVRLVILRVIWIMIFGGIVTIGLILYNAIPNNDGNILYICMLILTIILFSYYVERLKNIEIVSNQTSLVYNEKAIEDKPELVKYEKSKLTEGFAKEYKVKIEKVILEDQLYLKPTCSLDTVEKLAKIQKHHLSQFFSLEYGKHFNAYINELRIEYAKKVLIEKNYNVSISDLGEECGFNSRTSFFRAFKKYVGVSPTEYIENQQGQNDKQQ